VLLSRFHAVAHLGQGGKENPKYAMWELAENYMPSERCGVYTQAMWGEKKKKKNFFFFRARCWYFASNRNVCFVH